MSKHEEFPPMTPEALAAWKAACFAWRVHPTTRRAPATDRRALAALLREAVKQAHAQGWEIGTAYGFLMAIADNLHSPPPPPPTLAQAREAARQLGGENAAIVHAFLATLAECEL